MIHDSIILLEPGEGDEMHVYFTIIVNRCHYIITLSTLTLKIKKLLFLDTLHSKGWAVGF